jgi:hypothetical protein
VEGNREEKGCRRGKFAGSRAIFVVTCAEFGRGWGGNGRFVGGLMRASRA